jgi:hypothetical protein
MPGMLLDAKCGRRIRLNLTSICEPIVYKMWKLRRLPTMWAFTTCYRDSFVFLFILVLKLGTVGKELQASNNATIVY